jgi:solute carrier family 12 (potassium/chloride transporters), member 9
VQSLLESLRIEAILIVLCLSSTAAYQCIINGEKDVNGRVDDVLGDDQWWIDLKELRQASSSSSPMAVRAIAQATNAILNSLLDLSPSGSAELFTKAVARRGSLGSNGRPSIGLAPPKRRQSLAVLPQSFAMKIGVHKSGFFTHAASDSSSEEESDENESCSDSDSDADYAVSSRNSDEGDHETHPTEGYFSTSHGDGQSGVAVSPLDELSSGKRAAFSASAHASMNIDDDDKPHVSFKFTPPARTLSYGKEQVQLDFNLLPAKAQYLILNELIRSQSRDTAVVFTTLPAPAPGTHQDEDKSVEYVSGLELLCEDIPPVLLIHSNSLVVTLAL